MINETFIYRLLKVACFVEKKDGGGLDNTSAVGMV